MSTLAASKVTDSPPTAAQPAGAQRPRPRASLRRTVLGIAVAALLAAWLPFSVFYMGALRKQAQSAAVARPTPAASTPASAGATQTAAPVVTRTS